MCNVTKCARSARVYLQIQRCPLEPVRQHAPKSMHARVCRAMPCTYARASSRVHMLEPHGARLIHSLAPQYAHLTPFTPYRCYSLVTPHCARLIRMLDGKAPARQPRLASSSAHVSDFPAAGHSLCTTSLLGLCSCSPCLFSSLRALLSSRPPLSVSSLRVVLHSVSSLVLHSIFSPSIYSVTSPSRSPCLFSSLCVHLFSLVLSWAMRHPVLPSSIPRSCSL